MPIVQRANGVGCDAGRVSASTSPAADGGLRSRWEPGPGEGRGVLVVIAHADDLTLFIGGTVARWADTGWRVVVVRATDDRRDSVGLEEAETVRRNATELEAAAAILGVTEVVGLGWPTDTLADVSEVAIRAQLIEQVRRHRPYSLVTFDRLSFPDEDNHDHVVVAGATDEAFWTAQFDLHHPEQIAAGLAPHGAFERCWFGRDVIGPTHGVDISEVLDRKVEAARAHPTMLGNFLNQLVLQARTGGWRLPPIEDALAAGDPGRVIDPLLRLHAAAVGRRWGLEAAEELRVSRFGGLEPLLESWGERLPQGG